MGYHKIFGRTYSKQGTLAKPLKKTETVAIVAALSALCVATSYAMLPLFNIKLMDAIVFVAGFAFGAMPGMAIALTAWLVYGTINPLGLSLPVLISVMFTETTLSK